MHGRTRQHTAPSSEQQQQQQRCTGSRIVARALCVNKFLHCTQALARARTHAPPLRPRWCDDRLVKTHVQNARAPVTSSHARTHAPSARSASRSAFRSISFTYIKGNKIICCESSRRGATALYTTRRSAGTSVRAARAVFCCCFVCVCSPYGSALFILSLPRTHSPWHRRMHHHAVFTYLYVLINIAL